jgi:hypothetical protein
LGAVISRGVLIGAITRVSEISHNQIHEALQHADGKSAWTTKHRQRGIMPA